MVSSKPITLEAEYHRGYLAIEVPYDFEPPRQDLDDSKPHIAIVIGPCTESWISRLLSSCTAVQNAPFVPLWTTYALVSPCND